MLGGFGGMFDLSKQVVKLQCDFRDWWVGTKLILAIAASTIRLSKTVWLCVLLTSSLQVRTSLLPPDCVATGRSRPAKLEQVVAGVAEGCVRGRRCSHPVEKRLKCLVCMAKMTTTWLVCSRCGWKISNHRQFKVAEWCPSRKPSVLFHSNGYSLVRHVFANHRWGDLARVEGKNSRKFFLRPTRIYVKAVLPLIKEIGKHCPSQVVDLSKMSHVCRWFSCRDEESKSSVLPISKPLKNTVRNQAWGNVEIFNSRCGTHAGKVNLKM